MKNSPYLDQPFVPLAVAMRMRSMLADTEAKITTAAPEDRARLQKRAAALRDWLTPKSKIPH
jgi:hypothetical protein